MEGSKCEHCLQQCRAAPHFGQLPSKSISGSSVVEQLKHRAAVTDCTMRGKPRTGDVDGRAWTLGLGTLLAPWPVVEKSRLRVLIAVLPVLAFAFHKLHCLN